MDPRKSRSRRKLSQYALALVHQAIAPQGGLSFGRCPLLALSGHSDGAGQCPLSGVKRHDLLQRECLRLTQSGHCQPLPPSWFRRVRCLLLSLGAAMRRRDFITLLGGAAAAWPCVARAQRASMPVVGFLRVTSAADATNLVTAFRQGLKEAGFVEGQNVAVEYRWADGHIGRLPELAADLIRRQVAVIVGHGQVVQIAKAATATTPIVFVVGDDPVRIGLVANLNRPGGNVTGVTFIATDVTAKRLGLLHELVPKAAVIAVLLDPNLPDADLELRSVEAASRTIGVRVLVVKAATAPELDPAFATIIQAGAGALHVGSGPLFTSQRQRLAVLSARHALPSSYPEREYVAAGGLLSYGTSQADAYRRAGIYVARILRGEKPGDMPVEQPTKFELVINLGTAKTLRLTIPNSMQLLADEVIE